MVAARRTPGSPRTPQPPATTPEGRENQLIAIAMDLVEKRLLAGTATSQETTHFLKLGSQRERLERSKLEKETILLETKVDEIRQRGNVEELYGEAIKAMRRYQGQDDGDDFVA